MTRLTTLFRNTRYFLQTGRSRYHTIISRIRYHFSFTRRERLGFRFMLLILFISIVVRTWGLVKPIKDWNIITELIDENSEAIGQKIAATSINGNRKGKTGQQNFPEKKNKNESRTQYRPPAYMIKREVVVDLNRADTFDLDELRGIGPTYARRIVEYREKLGGFTHVEQLREVWGIDSTLLEKIKPYIYITEINLKKLNINTATIKQMRNHPYLDYYQAKEIYLHREKYGKFNDVTQLQYVNLIDSGTYSRIKPYLSADTATLQETTGKGK